MEDGPSMVIAGWMNEWLARWMNSDVDNGWLGAQVESRGWFSYLSGSIFPSMKRASHAHPLETHRKN